jgi:hypothetical protein
VPGGFRRARPPRHRADIYDDAVADAAFARLAELGGPTAPPRHETARTDLGIPLPPAAGESVAAGDPAPASPKLNAAARAMSDWADVLERESMTERWEELRRRCHPSFVFEDRRRMNLLSGGLVARREAQRRWSLIEPGRAGSLDATFG